MACLQICRELLSLTTFLRVHSNSKVVSYLFWQNTYPNLKSTCQIKLKSFLWTRLVERTFSLQNISYLSEIKLKLKNLGNIYWTCMVCGWDVCFLIFVIIIFFVKNISQVRIWLRQGFSCVIFYWYPKDSS